MMMMMMMVLNAPLTIEFALKAGMSSAHLFEEFCNALPVLAIQSIDFIGFMPHSCRAGSSTTAVTIRFLVFENCIKHLNRSPVINIATLEILPR